MKKKISDFIKYFIVFFFLIAFAIAGWNIIFCGTNFCWIEPGVAVAEFFVSILALAYVYVNKLYYDT